MAMHKCIISYGLPQDLVIWFNVMHVCVCLCVFYFLQERPEFSEVVAKLEECLCNVEVSYYNIKLLTKASHYYAAWDVMSQQGNLMNGLSNRAGGD